MTLFIIKTLHLTGFIGCLIASLIKNRLLQADRIDGSALHRLIILDKVSGLSAAIILITGVLMSGWFGSPTEFYVSSPLFWGKVVLFTAASIAILTTKPLLRAAKANGVLFVDKRTRLKLRFDFTSILLVAGLGLWLVRG